MSALATSPHMLTAGQQHQRAVVGVLRPVDRRRGRSPRPPRGGPWWSAGCRRTPGPRTTDETPGTISNGRPGLGAGLRLLGTGRVEERVAGHQPDDAPAALGVADHDLRAGGVGERLAVLAEAAVDEDRALGRAARRPRRGRPRPAARRCRAACGPSARARGPRSPRRRPASSSSTARTVSRSGSPGPLPTNDTHPRVEVVIGWWSCLASCVVHPVYLCWVVHWVARLRSGEVLGGRGRRRRRRASPWRAGRRRSAASAGLPVADIRTDRPPSVDRATARSQSSSPSSPSTTSASAPTGARAAALERGEHGALGVGRGAAGGVVEVGQRGRPASSSARHSTASAPWPGAGSICSGSSTSVTSSSRPIRARPARASRTASTRRSGPCRRGCRRCHECPPRPNRGRGRAAARPGAASRCRRGCPAGSSPSVSPSRATTTSRGSSREGTAARTTPSCGYGRQVLERVHGDVDLAGQQRVAQRADEDARCRRPARRAACRRPGCGRRRW